MLPLQMCGQSHLKLYWSVRHRHSMYKTRYPIHDEGNQPLYDVYRRAAWKHTLLYSYIVCTRPGTIITCICNEKTASISRTWNLYSKDAVDVFRVSLSLTSSFSATSSAGPRAQWPFLLSANIRGRSSSSDLIN